MPPAWRTVSSFTEPTVVIVKHANPCGVASADRLIDAYRAALACDSDLDYEGLDELSRHAEEDSRLDPVVAVVERCYAVEFDPKGHGVDTDELLADAVRTVRSWT